jgi:hypothetical protein
MPDSPTQAYIRWLHAHQDLKNAERKLASLPAAAAPEAILACKQEVAEHNRRADALLQAASHAVRSYRSPLKDFADFADAT